MVSVATWNLENLFCPGTPGGPGTRAAFDRKLDALTRTIDAVRADVWALQEVGDPHALDELVARLAPPPSGGTWAPVVSEAPDPRGIRVAVLTALPLLDQRDVVRLARRFDPVQVADREVLAAMGRGALSVTIDAGAAPLHVITCHLKSKLLSYPAASGTRFVPRDEDERARYAAYATSQRAAEAATVRVAATRTLSGAGRVRRLVVAGDLNDTEQAATTQLLQGPPGSELGTAGFDAPDAGDAERLWNLATRIPEERRYSRIFRGRRELIDHVLVSHALLADVEAVDTVLEPSLPSVAEDPSPRIDASGSDHAPLVLRLVDR